MMSKDSGNNQNGLRKLNKDLLTRNAELVKKLNRMKTERDNFEHLLTDWKNINKDASEALYNLQREKQRVEEENMSLTEQIKEYQLEINSLKLQNNERGEQCDHLLSRCNQYQNDIKNLKSKMRSKQHQNNAMNPNNINTLKFNYQQKKNEIDQILYQIQKLFFFCHANYPQITETSNPNLYEKHSLHDIKEYDDDDDEGYDDDHQFQQKHSKYNKAKSKKNKKHRSTQSLSSFDKQSFRKRRSLDYIYHNTQKSQSKSVENKNKENEKATKKNQRIERIVINKPTKKQSKKVSTTKKQITPQLLGPKTSYHQYDSKRSDPFGRTQSSHSFFNEYKYNQLKLNMNMNTKLWTKRDSLTGKKKQLRINAIPSSAGTTPLTTPQQSRRGKLSDDEQEDDIYFDDDPHQKYLEMMGGDDADSISTDSHSMSIKKEKEDIVRTKLTDKKTIHDLFDMLQQQTLSPSSPISAAVNNDVEAVRDFYDEQQQQSHNNNDGQLVPLNEPDSSSDSDSSSD